jgi:tetratricopeptide (TPR) repeat protein
MSATPGPLSRLIEDGVRLCAEAKALLGRLRKRKMPTAGEEPEELRPRSDRPFDRTMAAAVALERQGQTQEARRTYRRLAAIAGTQEPEDLRRLAEALERLGDRQLAVRMLALAAQGCERSDKRERAAALRRRIARIDPDHVPSRLRLADSALELGATAEGLGWLREALDILLRQSRFQEWVVVARQLLRYDPENTELAQTIARICFHRGDTAQAAEILEAYFERMLAQPPPVAPRPPPFAGLLAETAAELPTDRAAPIDLEMLELLADVPLAEVGATTKLSPLVVDLVV